MTLHAKISIAGLLVATLPTMAVAQVVTQPVQAQPAAVAVVSQQDSQQPTQQAIAHALGMAIRGSELQFIAQATRGGRFQNQNADNNPNQNAENKNPNADNQGRPQNAANDQGWRDRDNNADNKNQNADTNPNRRDRDNANNDADNQGRQQAARQAVQQLQQQAWHQFESSNQLLQAADNDIRALEGNAAQRGDASAWSRRLHTAASQYANTLRNLSGVNNRPAGSLGGQNDQDQQARRGDQDQDRGQNRREGGNLSRAEIAQATLINHAVCEVLGAYQLTQATGANRVAAQTTAGQQLQTHARQMTAEGQQILQAVIASANARNDNDANNANENKQDNTRGGQGAEGQASVRALAQQAQQVIDTLQRISGNAPAPAGAVTPGAVR